MPPNGAFVAGAPLRRAGRENRLPDDDLLAQREAAAIAGRLPARRRGLRQRLLPAEGEAAAQRPVIETLGAFAGDNGITIAARPAPFGISLAGATPFFYATLIVFLAVQGGVAIFVRSPLGISLRGTRDQPRRMTALGFNVWLIRFVAFVLSGLLSGLAGLLSLYETKFVSPHVLSLCASADSLLMVISGGTATLLGPFVGAAIVVTMKYIVSAYVERWNLVLGVIFVAIVLFMPEGLVPGSVRLWRRFRGAA
jgi:ABC-type branched-subunit amino acid transport system permease subunit